MHAYAYINWYLIDPYKFKKKNNNVFPLIVKVLVNLANKKKYDGKFSPNRGVTWGSGKNVLNSDF